jgi:hypothetical protein
MIPAHLRPYPPWAYWADRAGKLILLVGGLLIADEVSPGFWARLVCMFAAVLIWDSIFSRIRDVIRARKQREAG